MKILINDKQFGVIKDYLNEAKKGKYIRELMIHLGIKLIELDEILETGKTYVFLLQTGTRVQLKLNDYSDNIYTLTVVKDETNIFKNWEQLALFLRMGEGTGVEGLEEYKLNQNTISTNDDGETFDLTFTGMKSSGKRESSLKLRKVIDVFEITPEDNVQPEPEDNTPPEPDTQTSPDEPNNNGDNGSEIMSDANKAFKMISDDPLLKKAFYSQPSFMDLFVAELTGKKAIGKGIYSVLDLLTRFNKKENNQKLGANFIENEKISVKFLDSYNLKYSKKDYYDINYRLDKSYITIVEPDKLAKGPILKYVVNDDLFFEIELLSPIPEVKDGFICSIESHFGNISHVRGNKIKIQIINDSESSPGYIKKTNKSKK